MPETVVDGIASAVTHKEVARKSDGRKFTLYNVETDQGTFTTTRRELAAEAHKLVNKQARFTVKTEQRGEFTNYYLEAVEPIESAFPQQLPRSQPQPQPRPQEPIGNLEAPVGTPDLTQANKDLMIHRQTAAKVAAQVSRTPDEFWPNLLDLVHFFQTGETPTGPGQVSGGNPDDDIPF